MTTLTDLPAAPLKDVMQVTGEDRLKVKGIKKQKTRTSADQVCARERNPK